MRNRFAWQLLVVFSLLQLAIVDLSARGNWVVLENCRFILNPANDGDSFHVSVGDKEYIFRLYLVDAPEIEGTNPARLIEQAKYFEITVPQAIEVGEAAKAFMIEKLSEPFVVFTRNSDAMGRSKIERLYAFVQTREGDFGEQLVRNGLARVHGTKVTPPGFSSSQAEVQKLQRFEDEAHQDQIGGWGMKADRLDARAKPGAAPFTFFPRGDKAAATPTPIPAATAAPASTTAASKPTPAPSTSMTASANKLDINTASATELENLPGVGPVLAERIVAARPFKSADDLRNVKGIGSGKKYEQIRAYFN
jgi:competence ComEA-like helix-hairpin-helix protein